jgi:hypothetical protein
MSDIFYTEVDANLQKELLARAAAGRKNRRNDDINYMISKIANVTLTPFENPDRQKPIIAATLGGAGTITGEYLPTGPNGFLSDRPFSITDSSVNTNGLGDGVTISSKTNTSKRIPPYLTGVEIQIGDDSLGVMQTATISITIPNPGRDLNYFESVYMRPGRAVSISIDHPTTALLTTKETEGRLTDKVMPSAEKIKELYPNITEDKQRKFQKMNSFIFDGLIISFTLDYQQDASVAASLTIRGSSQIYTDISMIMTDASKKDDTNPFGVIPPLSEVEALAAKANSKLASQVLTANPIELANIAMQYQNIAQGVEGYKSSRNIQVPGAPNPESNSEASKQYAEISAGKKSFPDRKLQFADKILDAIESQKYADNNEGESTSALGVYIDRTGGNNTDISYIWGEFSPGQSYNEYISLKALIEFINTLIIPKLNSITGLSTRIIMDSEINISKFYPQLRSADPENIFFPDTSGIRNNYGALTWYGKLKNDMPDFITSAPTEGESLVAKTTLIYISTTFIQNAIFDVLDADNGTVNDFLKQISSKIYYASGGAYQMALITHPEQQNALLYYDTNNVKGFSNVPKPFSIPMFANNEGGTVVKDFQFNGKLPTDASTLAYVLNQDPAEISESDIAPFLSYMYSANTVTRVGRNEAIGNIITDETLLEIEKKYRKRHEQYGEELEESLIKYGSDINAENQKALHTSIKNYVQYPTPTIQDTNQFKAPIIPFDASFTIEGINGFRYGDVLKFEGLPDRYTKNTVFSIIGINHSVSSTGEWNTEIRCIMRPKID